MVIQSSGLRTRLVDFNKLSTVISYVDEYITNEIKAIT